MSAAHAREVVLTIDDRFVPVPVCFGCAPNGTLPSRRRDQCDLDDELAAIKTGQVWPVEVQHGRS